MTREAEGVATRNDDQGRPGDYAGPLDLPDEHEPPEPAELRSGGGQGSLSDDLVALLDDGRTYVEAEVAFQKSRAAYAADRAKFAVAYGLGAFGVLHLALIALTVGAVLALVPVVGAWAATGIVTLVLVLAGLVFLRLLKAKVDDIARAFSEDGE